MSCNIRVGMLALGLSASLAVSVATQGVRVGIVSPPPRASPAADGELIAIGTSSITGTVTAADTSRPIRGALVTIEGRLGTAVTRPGAGPDVSDVRRDVLSDGQGRFQVDLLPAGMYTVQIVAPRGDLLHFSYGQKSPGGPPGRFPLADGQRARLNLQMIRAGSILGTVIGADGEPTPQIEVQAWRLIMNSGVRHMVPEASAGTDGHGAYRLSGLPPGDYLVSVSLDEEQSPRFLLSTPGNDAIKAAMARGRARPPVAPGRPATVWMTRAEMNASDDDDGPAYLPVFYPGAVSPHAASIIHIAGGDEKPGIDIAVRLVRATNIEGTVDVPARPGREVRLYLIPDDTLVSCCEEVRAEPNGRFSFSDVAPGRYSIRAQVVPVPTSSVIAGGAVQPSAADESTELLWGLTAISVEGQSSLTAGVSLKPGRSLSGRLVFEMEKPSDLLRQTLTVRLEGPPAPPYSPVGSQAVGEVGRDGTFTFRSVTPGRYRLFASVGMTKSVMLNGQDLLDVPLEFSAERDIYGLVMTVTDRMNEISGLIVDAAGSLVPDYTVIAASVDPKYWTPGSRRVASATSDADGRYRLGNLPEGQYFLAVVTDLEDGAEYDPDFLKGLLTGASVRVSVSTGSRVTKDLRIARGPHVCRFWSGSHIASRPSTGRNAHTR